MSWQLQGLKFYLRHGVLNRLRADMEASEVREKMDRVAGWFPPPPPRIRILPVKVSGLSAEWVEAGSSVPAMDQPVVLFIHGGGYVCGSAKNYRSLTWRLAEASGARLLVPDYRLAPEHPCPAAVDDTIAAYRWLLERQGIPPSRIALAGDSAGGGLVFAALLKMKQESLPIPASVVGFAPWVDLAQTGASMTANAATDPVLQPEFTRAAAEEYVPDGDFSQLWASPLNGDHSGLPPVLLQVGSAEILLDDSRRLAASIRRSGGDVTLEIWPDFPHVAQLFAFFLPEGRQALADAGQFIARHWRSAESAGQLAGQAGPTTAPAIQAA